MLLRAEVVLDNEFIDLFMKRSNAVKSVLAFVQFLSDPLEYTEKQKGNEGEVVGRFDRRNMAPTVDCCCRHKDLVTGMIRMVTNESQVSC